MSLVKLPNPIATGARRIRRPLRSARVVLLLAPALASGPSHMIATAFLWLIERSRNREDPRAGVGSLGAQAVGPSPFTAEDYLIVIFSISHSVQDPLDRKS